MRVWGRTAGWCYRCAAWVEIIGDRPHCLVCNSRDVKAMGMPTRTPKGAARRRSHRY